VRVALCLSGQPRCLDQCFESLKQYIIDPYHADVFFHFWNTSYVASPANLNKIWYEKEETNWERFDSGYAYKYIHLMRPKRFVVSPQLDFDTKLYQQNCTFANSRMQAKSFLNVISMFYSIWQADCCRIEWETIQGFAYDRVIRCRTDLLFSETPAIEDGVNLSIPEDMNYGGLNDQFAFSGGYNMLVYSECFQALEALFRAGTNFHPETLLRDHIKQHNIPVRHIKTPYRMIR
jgi:hypothetical protein